ncbi:hypothetical protein ACNQF7_15935 [Flavobacterium sp. RSP29]|uniref:hypothetical protein n=1 Tax=Flavobacterium sp. RSP29 TaxID=3401731 RepID=UPI003AB043FF
MTRKLNFYLLTAIVILTFSSCSKHIAGMTAYGVEKNWWVTQTIGLIFQTGLAPHLVSRGGTSLSKA